MSTRLVCRFTGRVQGVGFRATVMHYARGLNVHGFVRNEPDGSVLLDADGTKSDLSELIRRVQERPAGELEATDMTWTDTLSRSDGLSIG